MKYMFMPEDETATSRNEIYEIREIFTKELNKFLKGKFYDESTETFCHVLRIFLDVNYYQPARQYSRKEKSVVVSVNIDATAWMKAESMEVLTKLVSESVLKAAASLNEVKQLPKTFDIDLFSKDLKTFFEKKKWI